jgi:hypothetical protein
MLRSLPNNASAKAAERFRVKRGYERLVGKLEAPQASTVEEAFRAKMRRLIKEFNASVVLSDARSKRGVKAGEMFTAVFTTCAVSSWES